MITFVEFAASHGLLIDELFTDGSRHRVPTDDDKPGRLVSWSFLSWCSNPPPNPNFRQLEMAKEILYRSSIIERKDNIDEEARTIELSFSSEAPVERVFGNEVLEHSAEAVDLHRVNDGARLF